MEKNITAERIKEVRKAKGITQGKLAEVLNVQRQIISYYETGSRTPNIDDIVILAKYFNVSADYLLGLSDVPTTDIDLKAVCDYTGFSEEFLNLLKDDNLKSLDFLKIINNPSFHLFLVDFTQYNQVYSHRINKCLEYQLERLKLVKELSFEEFNTRENVENNMDQIYLYQEKDLYLYKAMKSAEELMLDLNRDLQNAFEKATHEIAEINESNDPDCSKLFDCLFNSSKDGDTNGNS